MHPNIEITHLHPRRSRLLLLVVVAAVAVILFLYDDDYAWARIMSGLRGEEMV